MPVTCRTHSDRLVASRRQSIREMFATQLLAAARKSLGDI
jgi:hypothetical protein